MLRDITLGQYLPADSPLHRMDPRIKIILTILYIILLFLVESPAAYILCALLTAAVAAAGKIPPKTLARGLKPLRWLFVFTAVINLFMTRGTELWAVDLRLFTLSITYEGVKTAALLIARLTLLMTGSSVLTLTTPPLRLTDGIEGLLSPLKKLRFPAHETAMMMTIAIRFVPTLAEEAEKIMKAQKARGADLDSGGIVRRAKALLPVLVPLLISAFRRADELATAMDARCYNGEKRTRMKEAVIGKTDIMGSAAFALGALLVLLTN